MNNQQCSILVKNELEKLFGVEIINIDKTKDKFNELMAIYAEAKYFIYFKDFCGFISNTFVYDKYKYDNKIIESEKQNIKSNLEKECIGSNIRLVTYVNDDKIDKIVMVSVLAVKDYFKNINRKILNYFY